MLNDAQQTSAAAADRPRVLFVCKGSAIDGMGHVIRARTVAETMRHRAEVLLIAIGEDYVANLLEGRGVEFRALPRSADAVGVAREFGADVVMFDLLGIETDVFDAVAGEALSVSLSPIFDRMERVDILFHRTSLLDARWSEHEGGPTVRAGLAYTVIGDHCHQITEERYLETLQRRRLSVAVSMGGTDAANKTLRVIEAIRTIHSRLLLWVLLGEGYDHSYQDIVDATRGARHEIILAKTNDSMWHILNTCAVAILAGGTTTYQAAFAGLPSVNLLERAENYYLVQELVEEGACLCAGTDFGDSLENATAMVERLYDDRDELLAMHTRSKQLVDGGGADRIVDEVLQALSNKKGPR